MRPIHQPLETLRLMAGQSGVADHRQHGLIPLLSHAQL
jgi:hypothetical protein